MPTFNDHRVCTHSQPKGALGRNHRRVTAPTPKCGTKPDHIHPSTPCDEREFRRPRVTQSVAVPSEVFTTEASDGLNARTLPLSVAHL